MEDSLINYLINQLWIDNNQLLKLILI